MLYTKKQMEREVDRRMMEFDKQRWIDNRFRDIGDQIDDLAKEVWELRMKVDPEFKARMTPTTGCCEKPAT